MEASIVFPHQLFKNHPAIKAGRAIYLVEEWLFFRQYNFHKQKLQFHRASMQFYKNFLAEKQMEVHYIEAADERSDIRLFIASLAQAGYASLHIAELADDWLTQRINDACGKNSINLITYTSPNFLNSLKDADLFFSKRSTYFQTDFYIDQRKRRQILTENNKPVGGKWTYDSENRLKFPATETVPGLPALKNIALVKEAEAYTEQHFPGNYGRSGFAFLDKGQAIYYPVNFDEAAEWLEDFLTYRLGKFGAYEDAMVETEPVLYHSLLSPLINVGLLDPDYVIERLLERGTALNIPLNSLEGFTRQIIGWREFIRIVYEREGRKQRSKNYWNFKRKIPASFWNGTTGILPVDVVVKRILQSGYAHHIERLMVLGNFMLLCEFDPSEVYCWFMEMFIDAYDWVMVPNVYGMSQFADGGLMTTKPYISGSNYLIKMGNWRKGPWQRVWDGLFWRFMHVHRDFFLQNPRMGMLVKTFDKMPAEKRNAHLAEAEKFLQHLNATK